MKSLQRLLSIFAVATLVFLFQDCGSDPDPVEEPTPDVPVTITGISPNSGTAGTEVVISGTGFSGTASENIVTLNTIACIVVKATTTALTITIPAGAGTGKLKVTVKSSSAESGVFTYLASPTHSACQLDLSFDEDGKVSTRVADGENYAFVWKNAIQPDGKILVIGEAILLNGNRPFTIMRYLANGTIDNSWGEDGQVQTDFKNISSTYWYANPRAIVVQADNKIVVAGEAAKSGFPADIVVVRYMPDGTLDNTFSGDGILTYDPGVTNYAGSGITGLAIQADGKILLSGSYNQFNNATSFVMRLLSNGSFDTSFDGDGRRDINFGTEETFNNLTNVKVQADGKIVTSGYATTNYRSIIALARLNTDGTFDNTFSEDGKQTAQIFTGENMVQSSVIQSDGKILLGGHIKGEGFVDRVACILRYNADGSPDKSFGSFGTEGYIKDVLTQSFGEFGITPGGKILTAVGWFVARFNANGTRDETFCDGKYYFQGNNPDESIQTLSIQPDKAVVVSGLSRIQTETGAKVYSFYTARYLNEKE
jgi:uncharacterized delta-60 repeat protein